MPIQVTDINQSTLDNLQAQELTKPKTHIEGKVLETKLGTERALLAEKTAYEMMNAGEIPVMKIKKYPALAGPVPQGYFDEVKENYGDETAQKYKDFASYFTDYVKEEEQETIADDILAVFNNPGDEEAWNFFIQDLKEFSNGKQVSQAKLDELKQLTAKMGIALQMKTDRFVLSNVEKQKRIDQLKLELEKLSRELEKWEKEGEKWEKEGEKWEKEGEKWEKEGEKIKSQIKKLKKAIKNIQNKIDTLNQGIV